VVLAEELGTWLEKQGISASVRHRDVDR
jgi:hypothetical protein